MNKYIADTNRIEFNLRWMAINHKIMLVELCDYWLLLLLVWLPACMKTPAIWCYLLLLAVREIVRCWACAIFHSPHSQFEGGRSWMRVKILWPTHLSHISHTQTLHFSILHAAFRYRNGAEMCARIQKQKLLVLLFISLFSVGQFRKCALNSWIHIKTCVADLID